MSRFAEIELSDWHDIHALADKLGHFVCRGQSNSDWHLSTSIERCYQSGTNSALFEDKEYWVLQEFKEKFHLYSEHPPEIDNHFEWLALLQHYGCPTRLLDFTESIYVASYFALYESNATASIWAVNRVSLQNALHSRFDLKLDTGVADETHIYNKSYVDLINRRIASQTTEGMPLFVVPLRSTKKSIRLSRQQGLFLAPTNMCAPPGLRPNGADYSCSFMHNLQSSFNGANIGFEKIHMDMVCDAEFEPNSFNIIKITLPQDIRSSALKNLHQMNVTHEAMFPDLGGLCKGLTKIIRV